MIPVSSGREGWFLSLFVAQYLAGLGTIGVLSGMKELPALESFRLVAPIIIAATANTILLVEGIPMVAEQFLKRREARGEERGRRETQQLWEDWNRRRLEAEKKGEEFSEPPPGNK